MARSQGIYLPRNLLDSKAFNSLTLQQTKIYLEFLSKRQFPTKDKKRKKTYSGSFTESITNNGKITFSYKEAEKLGFSRPTFRTAIDRFIEVGLIDITKQGHGGIPKDGKMTGECTLFAISERWLNYGDANFKEAHRSKDTRTGRGWSAYHARIKRLAVVKD